MTSTASICTQVDLRHPPPPQNQSSSPEFVGFSLSEYWQIWQNDFSSRWHDDPVTALGGREIHSNSWEIWSPLDWLETWHLHHRGTWWKKRCPSCPESGYINNNFSFQMIVDINTDITEIPTIWSNVSQTPKLWHLQKKRIIYYDFCQCKNIFSNCVGKKLK